MRTADRLVDLYFRSVGHNGKLLLNVPPTRDGVLHKTDTTRLMEFGERRRALFAEDLAAGKKMNWSRSSAGSVGTLDLGRVRSLSIARLEEPIESGQSVVRYSVHGAGPDRIFKQLSRGTTIGYARLDRIPAADVRYVRVDIEESIGPAPNVTLRLFA